MSMTSQGFPLWAVESDGTAHAVVGWDEYGYPFLVPLAGHAATAHNPQTGQVFTFTTTDPSAQTFTAELVSEPDAGRSILEWSESEVRVALSYIADRLDALGATAPARRIREILESPAERTTWTPESVPASAVEAYREAWHAADDAQPLVPGTRTRAGLAAALNALGLGK